MAGAEERARWLRAAALAASGRPCSTLAAPMQTVWPHSVRRTCTAPCETDWRGKLMAIQEARFRCTGTPDFTV